MLFKNTAIFLLFCTHFALFAEKSIPITIEYAITDDERTWGLMGRDSLPENHSMLFIYQYPRYVSFWMFNCFIDLSIAYLQDDGTIQEIHTLKSYPEKMDPKRPIKNIKDFNLYPPDDPIFAFFQKNAAKSSFKTKYVLEMESDWFDRHGVKIGDRVVWLYPSTSAQILKTSAAD